MHVKTFQWRSLKTRLALFTLSIFLTGIWSLAYYATRMLREDMQILLGDQQFSSVSLLAEEVSHELDDRLQALEVVAGSVTPAMLRRPAVLQAQLEQRTYLQTLFNGGVMVLGLDGTAIADVPLLNKRVGVNYMDVEAAAAALREGNAGIGRPAMGRKLLAPVFDVAVPLRDAQGRVTGAILGVINLGKSNFLDKIMDSHYGKTGGYFLAAPQYRLNITATDKSLIMQPLPPPGRSPAIDRFVQGYEGSELYVNDRGVEVLVSAKGIPVSGWKMVAALPAQEAFAPIRAMQQRMLVAAILLTLLAGSLTWWLTWRMLRRQLSPMRAALRTLTTLSDSDQPLQPLPITSQDEIGEFIGGFNRLLEILAQREALLRQILDTSSVAIFLVDQEGRITQANQRMAEMFGCTLEALVGKEYVALVNPTEREIGRQMMQALLASEIESVDLERLYWRTDHSEFWGHLTGKRFYDGSGQRRGLVGVIADITERKQMEGQVRQLAFHDALTQLPNRRLLSDRMNQTMAASKRSGCFCALMFIDLDGFKQLNDQHGHEAGDSLLIEAASRLKHCVREVDTVARFGGDEFVVLLGELHTDRGGSMQQARTVAEKIRSSLAEPYLLGVKRDENPDATVRHSCSASIGVTLFINHEANQDEILRWADLAMYQAKEAGRNLIRFYEPAC